MATFEDVLVKAKTMAETAGKKTGELVDQVRLKMDVAQTEKELATAFEGLGRLVYGAHRSGEDIASLVEECAVRIDELTEKAEAAYRAYLGEHTAEALRWLLAERDTAGIAFLLERTAPDRETLSDACALARESGAAEAQAILLEEQHKRFPAGLNKSFDL